MYAAGVEATATAMAEKTIRSQDDVEKRGEERGEEGRVEEEEGREREEVGSRKEERLVNGVGQQQAKQAEPWKASGAGAF